MGVLLGLRPAFRGQSIRVELLPGERWLFYSDGLFESLDSPEESGYQRMTRYMTTRVDFPIEEACCRILSEHPAAISGKGLPDDFTVLMIERRTGLAS